MMKQQLKRFFKATTIALCISAATPVFAATSDEVVAVVGDNAVLKSDLDQMTINLGQQLQAQKQPIPSDKALRQQALNTIILQQAQLDMVKRYGIKPSDAEIDAAVLKYAQQTGAHSLQEFQTQLKSANAYALVRSRIAQELAVNVLRQQMVMSRIKITDQDVNNFLNTPQGQAAIGSQAHILHMRISGADSQQVQEVATQVKLGLDKTDNIANLDKEFSQGTVKVDGADMGYRTLSDIPAELAARVTTLQNGQTSELIPAADGIHILKLLDRKASDKKMMVTQYHTRHILVQTSEVLSPEQAKHKIDSIYKRLQAGGDFTKFAETYSNDPGSAAAGGDLGWVNLGMMVPKFEEEMQNTTVGQISQPFQTQFGWHILQVLDTRQQDMTKEYQQRLARQFLGEQQFTPELNNWLRELRANTYVDIKDPSLK